MSEHNPFRAFGVVDPAIASGGIGLDFLKSMLERREPLPAFSETTGRQHAGKLYEELTGEAPPVAGGGQIDKAARLGIAEDVGQGQTKITNSHVGKVMKASAGAVDVASHVEVAAPDNASDDLVMYRDTFPRYISGGTE